MSKDRETKTELFPEEESLSRFQQIFPGATEQTLARYRNHNFSLKNPISDVSLPEPVTTHMNANAGAVIQQMQKKRSGCALILDGNDLAGIFTERDVMYRLAKPDLVMADVKIGNVMTPSPEVLNESDPIAYALNKMVMGNYRHVPVRRNDGSYQVFSVSNALAFFF